MTPAHIILWHAASSRYVICQASRSRGVTVYQMVSGATYEYEADAQRHIDALNAATPAQCKTTERAV